MFVCGDCCLPRAGLLFAVGGSQHPDAPTDLSFRDNLAVMMEDDAWVPSHVLMATSGILLVAALLVVRRGRLWPAAERLLPFALVAATVNAVELVFHTLALVDRQELADGESPPLAMTHLALSVVAYPLFGIAIALLAWRLASGWSPPLRVLAVVGVVGGIANALSAPVAILTRENTFDFLFPVGGIAIAVWLVAIGAVGIGETAPPERAATT